MFCDRGFLHCRRRASRTGNELLAPCGNHRANGSQRSCEICPSRSLHDLRSSLIFFNIFFHSKESLSSRTSAASD